MARLIYANICYEAGNYQQAIDLYSTSLKDFADHPMIHRQVVASILQLGEVLELMPSGLIRSPIKGPKGNIEFLVWFSKQGRRHKVDEFITDLFGEEHHL